MMTAPARVRVAGAPGKGDGTMNLAARATERWPALPLEEWRETQATLHRWVQVVGKVKLALTPFRNEWWNVALGVTPRGLGSGNIPHAGLVFTIDFDLIDHALVIRVSDGRVETLPLVPMSVADFHARVLAMLAGLGIAVTINPLPAEIPDAVPFHLDTAHAAYDPVYAQRWWTIMLRTDSVLNAHAAGFVGKSSPVQFFWGSFDLSAARFSGRPADPPAGAPRWMQIAEQQENFCYGFWPGNITMSGITLGQPAFYAYMYPGPPGQGEATIRPDAAHFDPTLGEFILLYDDARRAASPERAMLEFFDSTYDALATRAGWDRQALERIPPRKDQP